MKISILIEQNVVLLLFDIVYDTQSRRRNSSPSSLALLLVGMV